MSLLLSSLEYYDGLLNEAHYNGTGVRKGNLEVIPSGAGEGDKGEIAICNLAALIPFSMSMPPMEGQPPMPPVYLTDMYGAVATQLALAVHHLNTGDGRIVRDLEGLNERCKIRFTLEFLDTALAENVAVNEVIQATDPQRDRPPVCAFQGASRSSVSMATATIAGIRGYPQISAASTSPYLSSANAKDLYPLFGRTIPSDDAIGVPIMDYFQSQLNIEHLAVLYVNDPYGTAFARSLHENAAPHMTIKSVEIAPVVDNKDKEESNVQRAVRELKDSQYQYIFAVINNGDLTKKVMMEAYEQGIAGTSTHTWLFSDSSLGAILDTTTGVIETNSPMHKALKGAGVLMASAGLTEHVPNLASYYESLDEIAQSPADIDYVIRKSPKPEAFADKGLPNLTFDTHDPYAPFIYDSIVALGLGACNAASQTSDGNISDYFTGAEHFHAMTRTSFVGTSGPVVLDSETGSRDPSSTYYGLYQVVSIDADNRSGSSNTTTGVQFQVSLSSLYDQGTWREMEPFVFADGSTNVLSDLPILNVDRNFLSPGWRVSGWILCGLGVVLAFSLALWTWIKARNKDRVVIASQPFFLYLICFGMATFMATIVPLGVDEQMASREGCTVACNAVPWLLSVGFCVAFSAMFTKTQRVNKIFKNARFTRIKVTPLDVLTPMLACLGTNLLLLIIMTVIKPVEWKMQVLEEDSFDRPTETWGFCDWSNSVPFLVPLAVINLGCLLFAMVQAYEARSISIEFAESEYIFRCMLAITVTAFLGFPVLVLIHGNNEAFYFFFSALIFITGCMVLSLIFVPKIRFIQQKEHNPADRARLSIMGGTSAPGNSRFFTSGSFSSSDEGLRVLHHPRTEAELRKRVADLEDRLLQFSESCKCGKQNGEEDFALLNPHEQARDDAQPSVEGNQDDPAEGNVSIDPQKEHNQSIGL